VAHASAVAATSDPFRALVKGDLIEARQRSAELKDVEPDDFIRFLEYAYRREYTAPSWVHDESASDDDHWSDSPVAEEPLPTPTDVPEETLEPDPEPGPDPEPEPEVVGMRQFSTVSISPRAAVSTSGKRKKSKGKKVYDMARLRSKFRMHHYIDDPAPNADMIREFKPESNSAVDQDFTPVFLAHAHLYTFADMRLIYPLKELALHKLYTTLLGFKLYNQRVGDVVKLARYAYDNGPDRSTGGTVNDLREMVVEYMACEVETVGKHDDFKALLEDGGEFATDFWAIVFKYLLMV
jgi:hypothetical protein